MHADEGTLNDRRGGGTSRDDLLELRSRLQLTIKDNEALLDRLRTVAVERDRIRMEADNRSSFWRRRFHTTGVAVFVLMIAGLLGSWALSRNLGRIESEIASLAQKTALIEETTASYAARYTAGLAGPPSEKELTEIESLKAEAARLRAEAGQMKDLIGALQKTDQSKVESLKNATERMTLEHESRIRALRNEKDVEIQALYDRIDTADDAIGRLKKAKSLAIPVLIDALGHSDMRVQLAAENALTSITDMTFGRDQARWRRWWAANRADFLIE